MRLKTPIQAKTPFAIDPRPLEGAYSAHAGLSAVSRVVRSLGLPGLCDAFLSDLKKRCRGFTPGQHVEALIVLHAWGGDCMDDMETLRIDPAVTKMLGYTVPSARAVGDFLHQFHDDDLVLEAQQRAAGANQKAYLIDETPLLQRLADIKRAMVRASALHCGCPSVGTIDQDATLVESHKHTALWAYDGSRGYQPMVAAWAETGLIVADEFRDGNVPAHMAPLNCAKAAFEALPATVERRYFRGDSACHEADLVNWLRNPERNEGPQGKIEFAISARMSEELAKELKATPDTAWKTFGTRADGTVEQWAEIAFVPGEQVEKKDIEPLRYVGLRLLKPQGELFADGHDRHFHAVITNRTEQDGAFIIQWHREKAGTIEHVHDDLKNGLGGGQLPCAKFGANAAWFRLACIAANVLVALRHGWPDPELRTAKAKRLRKTVIDVAGRIVRDRRKIWLRLSAPASWIKQLQALFEFFPLPTEATG